MNQDEEKKDPNNNEDEDEDGDEGVSHLVPSVPTLQTFPPAALL